MEMIKLIFTNWQILEKSIFPPDRINNNVQCLLYQDEIPPIYSMHYTTYNARRTVYAVHCTLYAVHRVTMYARYHAPEAGDSGRGQSSRSPDYSIRYTGHLMTYRITSYRHTVIPPYRHTAIPPLIHRCPLNDSCTLVDMQKMAT